MVKVKTQFMYNLYIIYQYNIHIIYYIIDILILNV